MKSQSLVQIARLLSIIIFILHNRTQKNLYLILTFRSPTANFIFILHNVTLTVSSWPKYGH